MATANLSKDPSEQIQFKQLLEEAVTKPGTLMRAYSLFWNYSLGNQILALLQANERGISLGPIASFNRWKELGRHVKRGEKAITLCMPVTCKRTIKEQGPDGTETESEVAFKRFVFRRNWFMLAQTDGAEYQPPNIPTWNRARSLHTLGVEEISFEMMNGNCQGYAKYRPKPSRYCASNRWACPAPSIAAATFKIGLPAPRFQSVARNASLAQRTRS